MAAATTARCVEAVQTARHAEDRGYPTILLADDDDELRCALVEAIRREGYLVLEAHDRASALHAVQVHSRRIHMLLIDASLCDSAWAELLKQYRPDMRIVLLARHPQEMRPDAWLADSVVPKVREYFNA